MKKLLILSTNTWLVITIIQSPTWCDIWNQIEILLTPLNQTLPPIIKSSLTLLTDLAVQVNGIIKQYLVRPLFIYIVFTVGKIAYYVCWKTGYFNYDPIFINRKNLVFRVYNAFEEVSYWIIRDFATQNPSIGYIVYSFCIIFTINALNIPLILLVIMYCGWKYGCSNIYYLLENETHYWRIKNRLKNKKLTFQRWEIIYNGGKLSPGAKKYLFEARASSKVDGALIPFWRAGWKGSGLPHYTNTNLVTRSDWDPSLGNGHSLCHSSNIVNPGKVANTAYDLWLDTAKNPGFYTPSKEFLWRDESVVIHVNAFDLYVGFFTFYQEVDELNNLLHGKWTFPAVTELKYQNDLYGSQLEKLITNEGVGKNELLTDFIQTIKESSLE